MSSQRIEVTHVVVSAAFVHRNNFWAGEMLVNSGVKVLISQRIDTSHMVVIASFAYQNSFYASEMPENREKIDLGISRGLFADGAISDFRPSARYALKWHSSLPRAQRRFRARTPGHQTKSQSPPTTTLLSLERRSRRKVSTR